MTYSTVINQILASFVPFPIGIEVGSGTTGTAKTYDVPFASAPYLALGATASSNVGIYAGTVATTGHTVTAQGNDTYYYIAIGIRAD